mmetsp:Transcript_13816/g.31615  ORF Transcript_13816/g.31615 Transcript_13816/m.31615 type:complete len:128 (-) Transcript_13816:94-477(-)
MRSEQFYVGIVRSVKSKPFSFKVQFLKRRSDYLWELDWDWKPSKHTIAEVSHCISAISTGGPGHYLLDCYDTRGEEGGQELDSLPLEDHTPAPGEFESQLQQLQQMGSKGSRLRSVVQFMDERLPLI